VIRPQLPKTSRMTCESVSLSALAILHQLTNSFDLSFLSWCAQC
jgi:hypothetical protein